MGHFVEFGGDGVADTFREFGPLPALLAQDRGTPVAGLSPSLLDPIRRGAERAGRTLDDIDLHINSQLVVSDDVESLIARARPGMAFSLGAMGSAK